MNNLLFIPIVLKLTKLFARTSVFLDVVVTGELETGLEVGLVDRRFCRVDHICPLVVAVDFRGVS